MIIETTIFPDTLYKDYNYDHKFSVTTKTSTGLVGDFYRLNSLTPNVNVWALFRMSWYLWYIHVLKFQSFTTSGSNKGETFLGDVTAQFKKENISTDLKVDTKSNVQILFFWEEFPFMF